MTTSWKLHRVFVGATQQEISAQTGISCAKLRQIEQGTRKPTKGEEAALLSAYKRLQPSPRSQNRLAHA